MRKVLSKFLYKLSSVKLNASKITKIFSYNSSSESKELNSLKIRFKIGWLAIYLVHLLVFKNAKNTGIIQLVNHEKSKIKNPFYAI